MLFLNSKNFWESIKRDKYLLLALFIGLLLRGLNPTFGSPSIYVSNDEAIAHLSAFNMIASKTLVTIANYAPLGQYIQIPFLIFSFLAMKSLGFVSGINNFELFVLTHQGYFLFIPRLISGFFGVLTILVIYKLTLLLFGSNQYSSENRKTAIIAAFLCAISFNLVHISHFGRPWSPALFFFVLAIYLSIKRSWIGSWIAVGLSYGFHQVGILAIPLVFWLTRRRFSLNSSFSIFISMLMIASFSSLTLSMGLVNSIRLDQSFLKTGKLAADFITGGPDLVQSALRSVRDNLLSYFSINLLITDGIIFLFSIIGIIKTFKTGGTKRKLIIYILLYFGFAILFFHPLLRYLLPIFLISIPFAAYGAQIILHKRITLLVIILAVSSVNSIWWNYLYIKTPTFIQARNWINQNISPDIPIAYIGGRYQTFVPNKNAVIHVQKVKNDYFKTLLPLLGDQNLDNVRNIIYTSNFEGKNKIDQLRKATLDYPVGYIVDVYFDPVESIFRQNPGSFDNLVHYAPSNKTVYPPDTLFDPRLSFQYPKSLIKFSMYSLDRTGPYIDILKLKNY